MAGAMVDTFGAPVIYTPQSGAPSTVDAILRTAPAEVAGEGGHFVLIDGPSLQVSRSVLPDISRGDRIASAAEPGVVYFVINTISNGSPASDALIICELERVLD